MPRGSRKSKLSSRKSASIPAPSGSAIIPSIEGTDLTSRNMSYDAHVRLEEVSNEFEIVVDIFKSKIDDSSEAYVESSNFPNSRPGANEAVRFLERYGFHYRFSLPTANQRNIRN